MKQTYILIAMMIMISHVIPAAALDGTGGYANSNKEMGIVARPEAIMAYHAVADGPATIFYNPGGLDLAKVSRVAFTYNNPYADVSGITSGSVALVSSLSGVGFSVGAVGFGINYFKSSDIYEADESGLTGGTFSDYELEAVFGWGKGFGGSLATGARPKVYFGMAMKAIQTKIYHYTDKGFGLDVGTVITPIEPLRIALDFDNVVAPNIELVDRSDTYPFFSTLGVSYNVLDWAIVSGEGRVREDGDYEATVGGEVNVLNMLFIRGGYEAIYSEYAAGAGFKYDKYSVDFSYKPHDELGFSYLATFGMDM